MGKHTIVAFLACSSTFVVPWSRWHVSTLPAGPGCFTLALSVRI